jgi:hypothetical protein
VEGEVAKMTILKDGPGTTADRKARLHDAVDAVMDSKRVGDEAKAGEPVHFYKKKPAIPIGTRGATAKEIEKYAPKKATDRRTKMHKALDAVIDSKRVGDAADLVPTKSNSSYGTWAVRVDNANIKFFFSKKEADKFCVEERAKAKDGFRPRTTPAPKKGYESFMDTVKRLKESKKAEAKDADTHAYVGPASTTYCAQCGESRGHANHGGVAKDASRMPYKSCEIRSLPSGRFYVILPGGKTQTGFASEQAALKWVDQYEGHAEDAASFIITATDKPSGQKKQFRVHAATEAEARKKFELHYSNSSVESVKAKDSEGTLKFMVSLKSGRAVIEADTKAEAAKLGKNQYGDSFVRVLGLMNGTGRDASPFDRDTDAGSARIVKREAAAGKTAKEIVAKYGFSKSFVDEEMPSGKAKDVEPVGDAEGAHIGMMGVNADKAKSLAKGLEKKGFEYRFPIQPPTADMVQHGFIKRNEPIAKNEWKILNERKNGFHNVTDLGR